MDRGNLTRMAILAVFCLLCAGIDAWLLGKCNRPALPEVEIETRTYYDTVRVVLPEARDSVVVRYETARLPAAPATGDSGVEAAMGIDTLHLRAEIAEADSMAVIVPISQQVYEDSTYRAWVSGFHARLDSIEVYARREVHVIRPPSAKPGRFGLAVVAGYGYGIGRGFSPFIGVGVSYTFLRF